MYSFTSFTFIFIASLMVWVLPIIEDHVVTCRSLLFIAWHLVDDSYHNYHFTYNDYLHNYVNRTRIGMMYTKSMSKKQPHRAENVSPKHTCKSVSEKWKVRCILCNSIHIFLSIMQIKRKAASQFFFFCPKNLKAFRKSHLQSIIKIRLIGSN